ncbi:MAG: hypothetical protein ACLTXM_12775 [Enterococcus sp.]
MFFKKKAPKNKSDDNERDIWGREPLALYEKVGRPIERDPENLVYSVDGKAILDHMVLFYKGKPDIRGVGSLLYVGEWINYGTKIYRVNTLLSLEELKELLIQELQLKESDFLVSPTSFYPRILNF